MGRLIDFYEQALFNPHWGEGLNVYKDEVEVSMTWEGLDPDEVKTLWAPFFDWVRASPQDFSFVEEVFFGAAAARDWWKLNDNPGMILDSRPDAAAGHGWSRADREQVSMFIHGYDSQWLPASLLQPHARSGLVDALVSASQAMIVRLHVNKGLAGATPEANAAARRCATNPAAADAFCLAIVATGGPPPVLKPDMAVAHHNARDVARAAAVLKALAPAAGSYISETDYFRPDWREAFWGGHYPRLKRIKDHYDPDGFFFVHHGVGSEDWSADGFVQSLADAS